MSRSARGRRPWRSAIVLSAALAIIAFALAGCGGGDDSGAPGAERPVRALATFSILGDMVRLVGGDRVEVTTLVGADGDAHVFEPSPRDGVALARADVIVENGLGFEPWLDELVRSAGARGERVVATAGVTPRRIGRELDPHAWQDVRNAMAMTRAVRDGLARVDPDGAAGYRSRAAGLLAELRDLDREVAAQIAAIPPERRRLVTDHDAFGYLADRYGLEVIGTVVGSGTTEGAEPSAGDLARLVRRIRDAGVPTVFAENIINPATTREVARAAGVRLGERLYSDALGAADGPAGTYIDMMRHNVRVLREGLGR
ncbi:MAG: zinc ABC transporter substrate-binding protein [Thermoleophilia bacterium]|jgi:zinc/manganese transport system substrate-binding protein|nr:zinc ABC transporter substrate-binding protein [Thermoleophilia bacterium]